MFNDIQKWQIEQLATNGGYSSRYIYSFVTGVKQSKVDTADMARVNYALKRSGVRIRDWRYGNTLLAKTHANNVATKKRRKRKAG